MSRNKVLQKIIRQRETLTYLFSIRLLFTSNKRNYFKLQLTMQINNFLLFLFIGIFFIPTAAHSQTINFDETWKEFVENNKISRVSQLVKPDKAYKKQDYAKYLLMNTNSCFCQSKVSDAEKYVAEIQSLDPTIPQSIPRFIEKMDDLEKKIKAYHGMDAVWEQFLKTKEVSLEELDAVKGAKSSCEKKTLAKYSYMTAYHHMCQGNIERAKNIFETRTLRLAEKTSLRVQDVEGLAVEVRNMKTLFQNLDELDVVWQDFVKTGESKGYDVELPLFNCYPIPNMKVLVLNGATDVCNTAPIMLEKIKELEAETGVAPVGSVAKQVKKLTAAFNKTEKNLADLNKAWKAFIPENKLIHRDYGYEYCTPEPLVRAYIMDGFAFVCEMAEENLQNIEKLVAKEDIELDEVTQSKINELSELNEAYKINERQMEEIWQEFISQGNTLSYKFISSDIYCDNVHQVKDWVVAGMTGTCEERFAYLSKIEEFQETFEFQFLPDLECRIQTLRVSLWDCRYLALQEMASIDVSEESSEERLTALMEEFNMGERPEECNLED